MPDAGSPPTGAAHLVDALVANGIDLLVGLPGTQTLPIDRVVADRPDLRYVMARHETAIPHVAWGYFETVGRPAATLTVPGPGETNAMHGLKNALEDSVPIVHLTGDAHPDERGKKPIHEIDPGTYDPVVKENVSPATAVDLPAAIERGITRALTPPMGPVRLGVPHRLLTEPVAPAPATVEPERVSRDVGGRLDAAADVLAGAERPVVYVGGGARRSPDGRAAVAALVDALDAAVLTSYKGKGVVPEDDPRFLGVTGGSLPPGARRVLAAADGVIALGTDFDGVTTADWDIAFGESLVHVTLDPDAIGAAYPADVGVVADVATAVESLLDRLGDREPARRWTPEAVGRAVRDEYQDHLHETGLLEDGPPLNTPAALRAVGNALPAESIVTADVGGFRLWAMQAFPVPAPTEFIAAGSWAGMGVGLPAAIGAKLARPETPVVCLTGDGGLLMCVHELATAVEENLDVVLVVSNNSDYGIISKKAATQPVDGDHPFAWASPDFTTIAEGFGWHATAVADAPALAAAVEAALARDGPTLVDVDIAQREPSAAAGAAFETAIDPRAFVDESTD